LNSRATGAVRCFDDFKQSFQAVFENGLLGIIYAVSTTKGNAMMKTLESMGEAIRNPKHPFRKTQHHSKKSLKNRHERRKIREYLQIGDWLAEEMV
jgi:hypothetical protein